MNEEFIAIIDSYNGSKFRVSYKFVEGGLWITEVHLLSVDKSVYELLDDVVIDNIELKLEKDLKL